VEGEFWKALSKKHTRRPTNQIPSSPIARQGQFSRKVAMLAKDKAGHTTLHKAVHEYEVWLNAMALIRWSW
jgi:hypothetical protein